MRQAVVFCGVLLGALGLLLGIEYAGTRINRATQAYLDGVDRWEHARQTATHHLDHLVRDDPVARERAPLRDALETLASFRNARLAMQHPDSGVASVQAHLVAAGLAAPDARRIARLGRHLDVVPDIQRAFAIWQRGDGLVAALRRTEARIRRARAAGAFSAAEQRGTLQRVQRVNQVLIDAERDFGAAIRAGHARITSWLFALELAVAGLALLVGVGFARATLRRNRRWQTHVQTMLQRLDLALEGASMGLWDWDVRSGTILFSGRLATMLGYAPDAMDACPSTWRRLVHPADRPRAWAALRAHLTGETPYVRVEYRMRTAFGDWAWILCTGQVVDRASGGRPRRVVGVHLDITARKEQEGCLRESEERWRRLVEAHPEPIHITVDGRYAYINPSGARLFGADDPDAMIGRSVFDFAHPEVEEELQERKAQLDRGEATALFEHRMVRLDGEERIVVARSVPITYNGEEAAQTVVRDVTEQRRAEQELIVAKEEAEEANRLKSAFLANMSHEIRTPLTSIIGFTELLSSRLQGEPLEFLRLIRKSSERLMRTLTSVLDLAQLESQTLTLQPEALDLRDEVGDALDLVRPQASEKGIALRLDRPDAPVRAKLDPGAVQRVLINLIANAVKFTHEGHVAVRLRADDHAATIAVHDTGVGIEDDAIDRIFDDFKQESEGFTRDFEGSGLGLAITQRLVTLMNGAIRVDSTKGEGSTFTVVLPLHPDVPVAPPDAASAAPAPAPQAALAEEPAARVLLVEDSAETREMVQLLLDDAEAAYAVDTAATVSDALAHTFAHGYDLLIVDINLGSDATGLDLLEAVRTRPDYRDVPAIACTAYAMPGDEQRFIEAGFDAYLAKPFRAEELLATVRTAMGVRTG